MSFLRDKPENWDKFILSKHTHRHKYIYAL